MTDKDLQPSNQPEISISDDPWKTFSGRYPITLVEAVLWLTVLTGLQQGLKWLVDNAYVDAPAWMPSLGAHAMVFLVGTIVLLLYWKLIRKAELRSLGLGIGKVTHELKFTALMIGVSILVYALAGLLFWLALHFFADDATAAFKEHLRQAVFRDTGVLHTLAVVLLYPVLEEIWYRGLLYTPMRQQMGRVPAIILLSLLFAFAHGTLYPVNQFIGGLIFVWAYEKSRSLFAPIVLHIAGNGALALFGWALENWPAFAELFQ